MQAVGMHFLISVFLVWGCFFNLDTKLHIIFHKGFIYDDIVLKFIDVFIAFLFTYAFRAALNCELTLFNEVGVFVVKYLRQLAKIRCVNFSTITINEIFSV